MIFNYERERYNKDCSRLTALYDTKLTNCIIKKIFLVGSHYIKRKINF